MADEELLEDEGSEGSAPKKKLFGKKDKGSNFDAVVGDGGTLYTDADEEEEGGGLLSAVIVVFIVVIWLAILALLVKLDVNHQRILYQPSFYLYFGLLLIFHYFLLHIQHH